MLPVQGALVRFLTEELRSPCQVERPKKKKKSNSLKKQFTFPCILSARWVHVIHSGHLEISWGLLKMLSFSWYKRQT